MPSLYRINNSEPTARLHRTRNPPIRRNPPPNQSTETSSEQAANESNVNVATAYSRDKKKMLRLTIVQRRSSIEEVITPTSSVDSNASHNSVASNASSSSSSNGTSSRDGSPTEEKMDMQEQCDSVEKSEPANEEDQVSKPIVVNVAEPLTNVTIVTSGGSYRMPSNAVPTMVGEPKVAIDLQTRDEIYMVVINETERKQYLTLRERLHNSENLWSEHDCMLYPEYEELCHAVLHRDSKIVQDQNNASVWYFIEPIPTGGTLHQYIQKHKNLDEVEAQRIFRMLLLIIGFCHKIGIMIRDLKLRKLVFDTEQYDSLRIVAPLELKVLDDPSNDSLTDRHGCPAYVSPEIVTLDATSYHGKPADMWSAGVLLYVMLVGRYPFYDQTAERLFQKIRKAEFKLPSTLDLSLDVRIIIHSLLRLEPIKRPSAIRLLRTNWAQPGAVKKMKDLAPPMPMRRYCEPDDHVVPVVNVPAAPTQSSTPQIQERLQNNRTVHNTA